MQKINRLSIFSLFCFFTILFGKSFGQTLYSYPDTSVLASGNWYKLGIGTTGIYKLTYRDLKNLGINVDNLKSADIAIFGNGGGMLPEDNQIFRYNDLMENAIYVSDGGDGVFNDGDYILFYAQEPNLWKYNAQTKKHEHENHAYSLQNYYFLTTTSGKSTGKRITKAINISDAENKTITTFNDFTIHEIEAINVHESGREWLGETFTLGRPFSFPFTFPNIVADSELDISIVLAARSLYSSTFAVSVNQTSYGIVSIGSVSSETEKNYNAGSKKIQLPASGETYKVELTYNTASSSGKGWLNYIKIYALRNLVLSGEQMSFRSVESLDENAVSLFKIQNTNSKTIVWDVTNPISPVEMPAELSGTELKFKAKTDSLKEFIVFNGSSLSPSLPQNKLVNQNLHATPQTDYVIVTHPDFMEQAKNLAELHHSHNNLEVEVVPFDQVYNEFSSGMKDAMAIRGLMKMLYDRSLQGKGRAPSYLLLLGSGTYDNKNILNDSKSLTLIYQSPGAGEGYATDDCYGYLKDNDSLRIGIGRLPVQTTQEAQDMVDKSRNYMLRKDITEQNMRGDWRNTVCLIADDPDGNGDQSFISAEEQIANLLASEFPHIHADKIYADSYKQVSSSDGPIYPEVSKAITNRVNNGCLMMSYVGHGSENRLGHESYITQADIASWTNKYALPLFVTNTCEFARLDLTGGNKNSAGENIVLSPNGACIALISATRKVAVSSSLNHWFFTSALSLQNGQPATFGDIVRSSKNGMYPSAREYMLIGDPALHISLPQKNINTIRINKQEISEDKNDTLKSLMRVRIEGEIIDADSNIITDFNGKIYPTVYDKPTKITTFGNEGNASIMTFKQESALLYRGVAKIENGKFDFSFIVPKDIGYNYGYGKMYYYAHNGEADASGVYTNLVVGGVDDSVSVVETYPKARLFMNDTNFVSGGLTDENPYFIAIASDEYGINTVGSGIGHDITAILDNKANELITLNSYFEPDPENPTRGFVYYQLNDLPAGEHTITFKVWNIFNYSTTESIRFVVQNSNSFELGNFRNYPNPCNDYTNFIVDHNYPDKIASAEIQIFNRTGQLICRTQAPINPGSTTIGPVQWNITGANGPQVAAGIYFARIIVKTTTGETKQKTEKLIVLPR